MEHACRRLASRIEAPTGEEYLWEPTPDAWSLRAGDDGPLHMQFGLVFDETPPVTNIAWRLTHIIDLLSEERCATWIGLSPEPENLFADGAPGTAQAARDLLGSALGRWTRYTSAATDLFELLGPIARDYAGQTRMAFILHIIDEVIHHGAEVGVLRDLYRVEKASEPATSALLPGDRSALDALGHAARADARAA